MEVIHKEGFEDIPHLRKFKSTSGTTLVDFQLFPCGAIDLYEIMGGTSPLFFWTKNHEVDDAGKTIKLNLKKEAHCLGSRSDQSYLELL